MKIRRYVIWVIYILQRETFSSSTFAPTSPTPSPTICPTTTSVPTIKPSVYPTNPTSQPSVIPSWQPFRKPSTQPSRIPSRQPSIQPYSKPTRQPTRKPSQQPTSQPSFQPTSNPSKPTSQPSCQPSFFPHGRPTKQPTTQPIKKPSKSPSAQPSAHPSSPSVQPTSQPTRVPFRCPTTQPSFVPTSQPSFRPHLPTCQPSSQPSSQPYVRPSKQPISFPSSQPTSQPFSRPSVQPSRQPTSRPTVQPSSQPTGQPDRTPSSQPSKQPNGRPSSKPSTQPKSRPSRKPTSQPVRNPSKQPSSQPTKRPSRQPSGQPTKKPILVPSSQPSAQPASRPSRQPSSQPIARPSRHPSKQPTVHPTFQPSHIPTSRPTQQPIFHPTRQPSVQPSAQPYFLPSAQPSKHPTAQPSIQPTRQPNHNPTCRPTLQPSITPSNQPTGQPTSQPQMRPSCKPSHQPTTQPTAQPTRQPNHRPSSRPTQQPSISPSNQPTLQPTGQPLKQPSKKPSNQPTTQPTRQPTGQPYRRPSSRPSKQPILNPSNQPSTQPTTIPSRVPSSQPSIFPSKQPILNPSSQPVRRPTRQPTQQPQNHPTSFPTIQPSKQPLRSPSRFPSLSPSNQPRNCPSSFPSRIPSKQPSLLPTQSPSQIPSRQPITRPTNQPQQFPSFQPSNEPTAQPKNRPSQNPKSAPSRQPSFQPLRRPTTKPSHSPSLNPSQQPSRQPKNNPSRQPTSNPSLNPTHVPTCRPSFQPVELPSSRPSFNPSTQPSQHPQMRPSVQPSKQPLDHPSMYPSGEPSHSPTMQPFRYPTCNPSCHPTVQPSVQPVALPSLQPSTQPLDRPSIQPTANPSNPSSQPTFQPTSKPSSSHPTTRSTRQPTNSPSTQPSGQPLRRPTTQPIKRPSGQPSAQPIIQPTKSPSCQPQHQPSNLPSLIPSQHPTFQPITAPTSQPSEQPRKSPSRQPFSKPSCQPSSQPFTRPTRLPTRQPFSRPSNIPSRQPFDTPSSQPNNKPTRLPTIVPTKQPLCRPSNHPSLQPSLRPVDKPTKQPSRKPSKIPTRVPTKQPMSRPTFQPAQRPSRQPSGSPSQSPTHQALKSPTSQPTYQPIKIPSKQPNLRPTRRPSKQPTGQPSRCPTVQPNRSPTFQPQQKPTSQPSKQPILRPTKQPVRIPTGQPSSQPRKRPSSQPSLVPSIAPTIQPICCPSRKPSVQPTLYPSACPSGQPSFGPSLQPDLKPSRSPTAQPFLVPSTTPTMQPSIYPTFQPTILPSSLPSPQPSDLPTFQPSQYPSTSPSIQPTLFPTHQPEYYPSTQPSRLPSSLPSNQPLIHPSKFPSALPSILPSNRPSKYPTQQPSNAPSSQPGNLPTSNPSVQPSQIPSILPTVFPSLEPSLQPTNIPSFLPSLQPWSLPSIRPSSVPSSQPLVCPSVCPSEQPTRQPSRHPSEKPSRQPIHRPTRQPTRQPVHKPSRQPRGRPSRQPTTIPILHPFIKHPTSQPVDKPSHQPTKSPIMNPTNLPSISPSSEPTLNPSFEPSCMPSISPSSIPASLPSVVPTSLPSLEPSMLPTKLPSSIPSIMPQVIPSAIPSYLPTSVPTEQPTVQPSPFPSEQPMRKPSRQPIDYPSIQPSSQPIRQPSVQPSKQPVMKPTKQPFRKPSSQPSKQPKSLPTSFPSRQPNELPTLLPTFQPSLVPMTSPSCQPSKLPSKQPYFKPSRIPSRQPILGPTQQPTKQPAHKPSRQPIRHPSRQPTRQPNRVPSNQPTVFPFNLPTNQPTACPTYIPSIKPTICPSVVPSQYPSLNPSREPSRYPSQVPSIEPSDQSNSFPSSFPSEVPTSQSTNKPSSGPSSYPSSQPIFFPSIFPTSPPSDHPTAQPERVPAKQPSTQPSRQPRRKPTFQPTKQPRSRPSRQPMKAPTSQPSRQPFHHPTEKPSSQPLRNPTTQPKLRPSGQPTRQPARGPSYQPTHVPQEIPSTQPRRRPSSQPIFYPTSFPSIQPNKIPSALPSAIPTGPTSTPSMQPFVVPSLQPFHFPTLRPSKQPIVHPYNRPTRQPASQPTAQPSYQPATTHPTTSNPVWKNIVRTAHPTVKPSVLPSSQPTFFPSANPSHSSVDTWKIAQKIFASNIVNNLSADLSAVYFSEILIDGNVYLGGSLNFLSFLFGQVKIKLDSSQLLSIQFHNTSEPNNVLQNTVISCEDEIPLRSIVNRLTNFSSESNLTTIMCKNVSWVFNNCASQRTVKLCVNCYDPCFQNEESAISHSCSSLGGCLHALVFLFEEISIVHPIRSIVPVEISTESITAVIELNSFAFVFCIASPSSDPIPTLGQILTGLVQSGDTNVTLQFMSLFPATNYSLYCVSQSKSGRLSQDAFIRARAAVALTLCCKILKAQINNKVLLQNVYYPNAFSFSVNAPPSESLLVDLSIANSLYANGSFPCAFSPLPLIFLTQNAIGGSISIGLECTEAAPIGIFELQITLSGKSTNEFRVSYPFGSSFSIIGSGYIGKIPKFSAAYFDNSGLNIMLIFTTSTNRASLSETFPCSKLLNFNSIGGSECRWVDNFTISIRLSSRSNINIGDYITLASIATSIETVLNLKEECPIGFDCQFWPSINIYERISIAAPMSAASPQVIICGPSVVSKYDGFIVDLRSSSNHGGRKWLNGTLNLYNVGTSDIDVSRLEATIMRQFSSSNYSTVEISPLSLPSHAIYSIVFTLCNWLMKCGRSIYTFSVVDYYIPSVALSESSRKFVKQYNSLSLFAQVKLIEGSTPISYWQVMQNNVVLNDLISESNQTNHFYLSANSLTPGEEYQVVFTVTDLIHKVSSSASITVCVLSMVSSDVVAIISQGKAISVEPSQVFTLDASQSYNRAFVKGLESPSDGLIFSWYCQPIGPVIANQLCPLAFASKNAVLLVTAPATAIQMQMLITLTVQKDIFQTNVRIEVTVLPMKNLCQVEFTKSSLTSMMLISEKQKFFAAVKADVVFANYSWSLVDSSGITIQSQISQINAVGRFSSIAFAIPANFLQPSSVYSLQLSCFQRGYLTFASISLLTNSPPQPGIFTVYPSQGEALLTQFTLTANYWSSDNLPLFFEFGFVSNSGDYLPLQPKSEQPYTESVLPSVFKSSFGLLNLYAIIFDIVNANSSEFDAVTVFPSNLTLTQLRQRVESSEYFTPPLSIYSSHLNSADCSLAPNCTSLNRKPCTRRSQTCGSCISGFIGIENDDNSFCFPLLSSKHRRLKSSPCNSSSAACKPFEKCVDGNCIVLSKTCTFSCSNKGACVWYNINSGYPVLTCLEDDFSCSTRCECQTGYYGDFCSETYSEFSTRQFLRGTLISYFRRSISYGATDTATVRNWISLANSLAFIPRELSEKAVSTLLKSIDSVLEYSNSFMMSYESIISLNICFNKLFEYVILENSTHLISAVDSSLRKWSDSVSADLINPQSISVIQKTYRIYILTLSFERNISVQEPLTQNEEIALSRVPVRITIYSLYPLNESSLISDSSSSLSFSFYTASLFGANINTNPTGFHFSTGKSNSLVEAISSFAVDITMSNILEVSTAPILPNKTVTTCENSEYASYSYKCEGGFPNISASCSGIAKIVVNQCPSFKYSPTCSTISLPLQMNRTIAHLLSDDKYSTGCRVNRLELLTSASTFVTSTITVVGPLNTFQEIVTVTADRSSSFQLNSALLTMFFGLFILVAIILRPSGIFFVKPMDSKDKKISWKKSPLMYQRIAGPSMPKNDVDDMRLALEETLSPLFCRNELPQNILLALGLYHYFLGSAVPSIVRILNGLSNISTFIFFNFVVITLFTAFEDVQCRKLDKLACNRSKSSLDTSIRKCEWDNNYYQCGCILPTDSALALLQLTLIAQFVCIPVVQYITWTLNRAYAAHLVQNNEKFIHSEKSSIPETAKRGLAAETKIQNRREWPFFGKKINSDQRIENFVSQEIARMKLATAESIGRRLLCYFLIDTLDISSALIVRKHFERLYPHVEGVSPSVAFTAVVVTIVVLFSIAIGLAASSSQDAQITFSKCFLCWIFTHVFVVQPIVLIETLVFIPLLAQSSIRELLNSLIVDKSSNTLTFVSASIAARFPDVPVHRLISSVVPSQPISIGSSSIRKTCCGCCYYFLHLSLFAQDVILYYLTTGAVVGIGIAIVVMVQFNAVLVLIPISLSATAAFYIFFPRSAVEHERGNDFEETSIVDLIDMPSSKLGFPPTTESLLNVPINVSPLSDEIFPIPDILAHILPERMVSSNDERRRKISTAEQLYQSALAAGVSTENGRLLLLQSAVEAMEAGLISTAKSRLERSLLNSGQDSLSSRTPLNDLVSRNSTSTKQLESTEHLSDELLPTSLIEEKSSFPITLEERKEGIGTYPIFDFFESDSESSDSISTVESENFVNEKSDSEVNVLGEQILMRPVTREKLIPLFSPRRSAQSLSRISSPEENLNKYGGMEPIESKSEEFTIENIDLNFSSSGSSDSGSDSDSFNYDLYFQEKK